MNILFTICGRAGSKGIKNKNIRNFLGKPLSYFTLSTIEIYKEKHRDMDISVALNTDSSELKQQVEDYRSLEVMYIPRKSDLANDIVAKRDVIIDTLIQMQEITGKEFDIVVDLDITSPLRTVANLEDAISKQIETKADVVFSVTPSRRNPYFNMVKKKETGVERAISSSFTTRQEAPEMFDMNASIYVYKAQHLMDGKGVLEGYNEMIQMMDTGVLDLDHEGDFELMEVIAEYLVTKNGAFRHIYENIMSK